MFKAGPALPDGGPPVVTWEDGIGETEANDGFGLDLDLLAAGHGVGACADSPPAAAPIAAPLPPPMMPPRIAPTAAPPPTFSAV